MPEGPGSCGKPNFQRSGPAALGEFELISKFFDFAQSTSAAWPSQGIGDDCAFLDVGALRIAVTSDMMALGTHFFEDAPPYTVGRKALAVNLSDLAAAGSTPQAFFLSISLPEVNGLWLSEFSRGLKEESERYCCPLRGGDTVRSFVGLCGTQKYTVLSICALGSLPPGAGLTRSGAQTGDIIWVSGTPGDAACALGAKLGTWKCESRELSYFLSRLQTPTPRVELGERLLGVADACCDISDGLLGDLGHILERSDKSAELFWDEFPLSEAMRRMPEGVQKKCVLSGGDDYELLFTAPEEKSAQIKKISQDLNLRLTPIGRIDSKPRVCEESSEFGVSQSRVTVLDTAGRRIFAQPSFDHFHEKL